MPVSQKKRTTYTSPNPTPKSLVKYQYFPFKIHSVKISNSGGCIDKMGDKFNYTQDHNYTTKLPGVGYPHGFLMDSYAHQEKLCKKLSASPDPIPIAAVKYLFFLFLLSVKGEVRSWYNLILEERVKFSEQNSENLMKIGWKVRKLWHFEVLQIFRKHFLTSRYEYANEWVDDVIASQLSINFVHRNDKNFIFQLW